jgi:hypothetical protein
LFVKPRTTPRRTAVPCAERVVPQSSSRRVESLQVDVHACRGHVHPSAQGRGLAVGTPPPLSRGVAWRHRGSVSTSHAAFFDPGSRSSCQAALVLVGTHAHGVSQAKRTPAQTRAAACTATPRVWWLAVQSRGLLAVRGRRGVLRKAVGTRCRLVADPSQPKLLSLVQPRRRHREPRRRGRAPRA